MNKLRARYSKRENDTVLHYPLGRNTKCDASYLSDELQKIRIEMEKRGYDWQTFKFEISPKLPNFEKFSTLSKEKETIIQKSMILFISTSHEQAKIDFQQDMKNCALAGLDIEILPTKEGSFSNPKLRSLRIEQVRYKDIKYLDAIGNETMRIVGSCLLSYAEKVPDELNDYLKYRDRFSYVIQEILNVVQDELCIDYSKELKRMELRLPPILDEFMRKEKVISQ